MKIRFWERLLIAFSGLIILMIGIGLFVFGAGVFPFQLDTGALNGPFVLWQRIAMVAVALALCALGAHGVWMLFRREREKGFIIQHTEYGDMSISMNAMENMVRKCVDSHQELTVNSTRIHRGRDGVVVDIKITLAGGINIPLTVNALQKQIRQYITSCSGVDVSEVRVMVETNAAKTLEAHHGKHAVQTPEKVECVPAQASAAGAKPDAEADHPIFSHTEAPESYAEPGAEPETVPVSEQEAESAEATTLPPEPLATDGTSSEPPVEPAQGSIATEENAESETEPPREAYSAKDEEENL